MNQALFAAKNANIVPQAESAARAVSGRKENALNGGLLRAARCTLKIA